MSWFKNFWSKISGKKGYYTTRERREMLKSKSKNELIQMLIRNELVIANMMKKFKVKNPANFL